MWSAVRGSLSVGGWPQMAQVVARATMAARTRRSVWLTGRREDRMRVMLTLRSFRLCRLGRVRCGGG